MRSEKDELIHLALRQARRREGTMNAVKAIFIFAFLAVLCGLLQNCGCAVDDAKPTAEQIKKSTDAVWAGTTDAKKQRF